MSDWQLPSCRGSLRGMMSSNPYRGFRVPPEVIQHAVWLYHCFSLSLRDVELILAALGIAASAAGRSRASLRCVPIEDFGGRCQRQEKHPRGCREGNKAI